MSKGQQPESGMLFQSPEEAFNVAYRITDVGAALVRPIFLHSQGTRAFGKTTFLAFLILPVLATFTRSHGIELYWKFWCVMLVIRWLTPDRSQSTHFWGTNRILDWLPIGNTLRRFIEPPLIACLGLYLGQFDVPLSRVILFGAFCMLYQYRIGFELLRREREAIHNATVAAGRYR